MAIGDGTHAATIEWRWEGKMGGDVMLEFGSRQKSWKARERLLFLAACS